MPKERDMSEVVDQYMAENKMHCMEGTRGVKQFEKLARALGYSDTFSVSTLHAFLEDNSGCLEAMVEWIKESRNPDWKAELESQLEEPEVEDSEDDEPAASDGPTSDINGELEDWSILSHIPS